MNLPKLPVLVCTVCSHRASNCPWLAVIGKNNENGKVVVHLKDGNTISFRVMCCCDYGG
jgi:hypothetical protein